MALRRRTPCGELPLRGIWPAPGYRACPDPTEKWPLFDLLQATDRTSIWLTEHLAMFPTASVSGLYFAHPESKYFAVGNIGREQAEDYAERKQVAVEEVEHFKDR